MVHCLHITPSALERESERESECGGEGRRERESQADSAPSAQPDTGLDSTT